MPVKHSDEASSASVVATLMPVMAAVLVGFIIIGVALPVLPLHVKNNLGYGTFIVGLVAGAQFAASLISRVWSGSYSDRRGAKKGVVAGLIAAAVSGLLYLTSLWLISIPVLSVAILLAGRAILGGAESFIITGAVAWGLALVDKTHAGKVIAWVGTAMFAAMALGGPVGTLLFDAFGFKSIALLTLLLPLLVLAYLSRMPAVAPHPQAARASFGSVMRAVWLPGLGAALASTGYCTILAFSSLYYSAMHWQPVWMAFTAFGVALIVARTVAGHLPDRFGGARIALIFVLVQAAGLFLIWLAGTSLVASVGAAFAGFGYSLVYPGLGIEAISGSTPQNRGMVMGIYTAFLDVAMAIGSPALGWIGGHLGLNAIFLTGALIVLSTAMVAYLLLKRSVLAKQKLA
ncbi:putative MFS family arabinose efflux permease [Enterobacter sp. BIGb0383]|uniref:MFS transporter n=1 Tax=unclassified Enterobacter TaxID=2608935 RepID=UPI000F4804E2|nr:MULTISPECIES: MFS transporter [unclassified Enterobacter]ROP62027.1 putative MFS family arabinose efflux permease [Enterobacter sp. BIGb0383]ROS12188.1 putative MFS family arabinose efflux permease [Enterobacter sp. BIGb0359]